MTEPVTLGAYEQAERALAMMEARRGLLVHATVTVLVWAILIPINVLVASEFPWSALAVAGMSIGLLIHYLFGVRWLGRAIEARQRKVERWAAELKGA